MPIFAAQIASERALADARRDQRLNAKLSVSMLFQSELERALLLDQEIGHRLQSGHFGAFAAQSTGPRERARQDPGVESERSVESENDVVSALPLIAAQSETGFTTYIEKRA